MYELTPATMPEFLKSLCQLLENRRFTYYDASGQPHIDRTLRTPPVVKTSPGGAMYISLDIGGVTVGFNTPDGATTYVTAAKFDQNELAIYTHHIDRYSDKRAHTLTLKRFEVTA
jgi:hypothetical protein